MKWLRRFFGWLAFGRQADEVAVEVREHDQTRLRLEWEITKRDAEIASLRAQIEFLAAANRSGLEWIEKYRAQFAAEAVAVQPRK